jgi:hypothetical protein
MKKRHLGFTALTAFAITRIFTQSSEEPHTNAPIKAPETLITNTAAIATTDELNTHSVQPAPPALTPEEQELYDKLQHRIDEQNAIYAEIHERLHPDLDNEIKTNAIIDIIFAGDEQWLYQLNEYGQANNIDRPFIDAIESLKDDLKHLDTSILSHIQTMLSQRNEQLSITAMNAKRNAITSDTYDNFINDFIASNEENVPAYLERISIQGEASLKYKSPQFPEMNTEDNVKALIIDRFVDDSFNMRDYPTFLEAKIIAEDTNEIQSFVRDELDKRTDRQPNRVVEAMRENTMGVDEIN